MTITVDRKVTWQDRLASRWAVLKPLALALGLGLVAGPLISSYMGWQVTRGTAERQSHASAVDQQAMICAVFARKDTADTAGLSWSDRRELAEKYAIMPGRSAAESDVVNACTQLLVTS